jgi:hypothetical protein
VSEDRAIDLDAVMLRIVCDFGDGTLRQGKYLFEQITRLPDGCAERRIGVGAAFAGIASDSVLLVLDPHPNNRADVQKVVEHLGAGPGFLFKTPRHVAEHIVRTFDACDMYVTTLEGDLLLAACHEDSSVDGQRIVWAPHRA